MKAVILAGGYGTRLAELTKEVPKPLVEVGGRPILWHILKIYAAQGLNEFVIALGYKGHLIKDYFLNYHARNSNVTVDLGTGQTIFHGGDLLDWKITLVDTGGETMTGGRIRRLAPFLGQETFMMTYGDGVADVDLQLLLRYHRLKGGLVTVTAVHPTSRYGKLELDCDGKVQRFSEKPEFVEDWINGGFFVMEPAFLDLISGDDVILERKPLEIATEYDQFHAYRHDGFWHCMDTLRDRQHLNQLWSTGNAPWKIW
jgi:glucose-1-phosphate cytidylyltransferase